MNTITDISKTSLNPQDRYYKPFNWLANGLIGVVELASNIGYVGLILGNLAALIPNAIYSTLTYLIFPSLTEEQKSSVNDTTELNDFYDYAVDCIEEFFTDSEDSQAKPMINNLCDSEFRILLTKLTNIPTQEGFWDSPYLLTWAIVQAILALPFLIISFFMDVYKFLVLPIVILCSIVCGGVIYLVNHLWKQIITAPITIWGNNESQQQTTMSHNEHETNATNQNQLSSFFPCSENNSALTSSYMCRQTATTVQAFYSESVITLGNGELTHDEFLTHSVFFGINQNPLSLR